MIYQCLSCGESFKEADGQYKYGYLICPVCGSEDLIVIWDESKPATTLEDFIVVQKEE